MKRFIVLFLFIIFIATPVAGESRFDGIEFVTQEAEVVRIEDGDTIYLRFKTSRETYRANLIGVDACGYMEYSKCLYIEAEDFLAGAIRPRRVTVKWDSRDKYTRNGRLLVYIEIDGRDINKEVIENGFGWVPRKFTCDRQDEYLEAEAEAREAERGLWGDFGGPPCQKLREHLENKYYRE